MKKIFIILFLISSIGIIAQVKPNDLSCESGTKKAIVDAKNKKYKFYATYGLIARNDDEWKFQKFYQKYMKSKYGIIVRDGGCIVSPYSKCYKKKMDLLMKKEFGSNIFKRTKAEARKLYKK